MEPWLVVVVYSGYFWLQLQVGVALTSFSPQEDRLWIADPKAINHIFKNSSALYRKLDSTRAMTELIIDRGLAWAEGNVFSNPIYPHILTATGEAHRRQRRAMTPAFGLVEAKGLLPYFAQSATKVRSCLTPVKHCDRSALHAAGR